MPGENYEGSAQRLEAIVVRMSEYSHKSGRKLVPVRVNRVARDVCQVAAQELKPSSIRLDTDLCHPEPVITGARNAA